MKKCVLFVLFALLIGMVVVACGKKADPRPVLQQPATTSAVAGGGNRTMENLDNKSATKEAKASSHYTAVSLASSIGSNGTRLCWSYTDSAVEITRVEILRSALDDESGEKAPQFAVVKVFDGEELKAMNVVGKGLCYTDADAKGGVLYTYKISICDVQGNCYTPAAMTQIKR